MLLTDDVHLAAFRREADRCGALARDLPLATPLPHLPRWTVGSVIGHLIGDFRWASGIIRSQEWDGSGFTSDRHRGDALVRAFDESVDEMEAALRLAAADPTAACPNFADRDAGVLGWWPRHQAAETLVHRWDMETVTGHHEPIEPAIAVDAIDEALHVYTRRYGPHRLAAPIVLRCTGADAEWTLAPAPGRRVEVHRGVLPAETEMTAAPDHLLLAVWKRVDVLDGATVEGDEHAVAEFFRGPLTA